MSNTGPRRAVIHGVVSDSLRDTRATGITRTILRHWINTETSDLHIFCILVQRCPAMFTHKLTIDTLWLALEVELWDVIWKFKTVYGSRKSIEKTPDFL